MFCIYKWEENLLGDRLSGDNVIEFIDDIEI
jgi:hypothetical protein